MSRMIQVFLAFLCFWCAPAYAQNVRYDQCRQESVCVREVCEMNAEAAQRGLPYFYEVTGHPILQVSTRWGLQQATCSSPPRRVPLPSATRPVVTVEQGDQDGERAIPLRQAVDAYIERMKAEGVRAEAEARRADAEAARADVATAALRRAQTAPSTARTSSPHRTTTTTSTAADVAVAKALYAQLCSTSNTSDRCQGLKRIIDGGGR